ncbi:MAG: hypothetical protein K2X29_13870 [Candidatus Obscuribacterales bacterium]|nr:hypothetical protein [Candidatus Obscuribacterales bacterium]
MYPTESFSYDEPNLPLDVRSGKLADPAILLADANDKDKKAPMPGFLERLSAAKDRFFNKLAGLPEVEVSKDHTAQVRTDMEYTVLLEKTTGSLCTFFYQGSDEQQCKLKDEVTELSQSLNGKATFAFVDSDRAKKLVGACALTEKLPAFAIADKNKQYLHLYTRTTNTTSFKELIDRFERGETRKED